MKDESLDRTGQPGELPGGCRDVFQQEGVAPLASENLQQLLGWIEKGRDGEPVTVVSPVCPDYSVESSDDRQRRYTFDKLNSGIGPMAALLYRSLPKLHALFSGCLRLPNFEHFVCVCDFDGFYENNLRRLGVTEAQFRAKVLESCEALRGQAPGGITASLLSEHCGGKVGWLRELGGTRKRLSQIEDGDEWESATIRDIARERRALYQRWLGEDKSESLIEVLVTAQGIEYATAGRVIKSRFQNPLILTAGNAKWERFFRAFAALPVLCLSDPHL
jgi:hypothetical protein